MYTVECDGEVFYDDTSLLEDVILIEPNVSLDDNAAGSFDFAIPKTNRAYNKLKEMTSTIMVKKNGKYVWSGRIITLNIDFYGRKKATCEGALAYLNDVIILPKKYQAPTINVLLSQVLTDYNARVPDNRKIYLGAVTVHRDDTVNEYEADYITCFDFINENLITPFAGHLFITYENGLLKLNYYQDYPNTATQSIDFGVNLLDFTTDYDYTEICTVCIPRGKQQSNTDIVNRSGTSYESAYSADQNAINNYNSSDSSYSHDQGAINNYNQGNNEMGEESYGNTSSNALYGSLHASSDGEMGEETYGQYSRTTRAADGEMGEETIGNVYTPNSKSLNSGTKLYNSTNSSADLTSGEDYSNKYITVEDVNGGSPYVENALAIKMYGRVERVVDFDDVDDPTVLLQLAHKYMENLQFDQMTLTIKAVDLHMLDPSIKSFDWLDNVHCVSLPHGMDKFFPINSVSLPLDNPENVEYTLGRTDPQTLSGIMATAAAVNQSKFNEVPTRESVLVAAKRNATEILNRKTAGFVNIVDQGDHSEAIIISNIIDWQAASQYWKFDMNGLGFFKDGKLGGIAITMDGQIVADYITTGTMSADRIRTGIIKDIYNNNVINLETGEVFLQASKTTVKSSDGKNYTVASSKDISKINSDITSISSKQMTIETSLDGITTSVRSLEASYGTCTSAGSSAKKYVTCNGFTQLKEGAVVVVKFTYKNTASQPKLNVNGTGDKWIVINGSYIGGKYNWGAGQTVTFVYGNGWWNVADGATESKIQQLAHSITLSVTGKLGNKASIKISADSDGEKPSGYSLDGSIDLSAVREAFKNDPTTITITSGRVNFKSGTFTVDSGNINISSDGTLRATNAYMQGKIIAGYERSTRLEMDMAQLKGYSGNSWVGTIAPNGGTTDVNTGTYYPGIQIRGSQIVEIRSPRLGILNSNSTTGTSIYGANRTIRFGTNLSPKSDGGLNWDDTDLQFINGILVSS